MSTPMHLSPEGPRHLIIVVRADPIICGHSTEARNLAEAAMAAGFDDVHIVSYPIELLQNSGLPLKPLNAIEPYSEGITVLRPDRVGGYKVLDGGQLHGMSGSIVDLLAQQHGTSYLMDLYLVPHGKVVLDAARTATHLPNRPDLITIGEAVGSDITDVVRQAIADDALGAACTVLADYLDHDLPVAVSDYTRDLIVAAGSQVDDRLGTSFADQLDQRVTVSYPAIDAKLYLDCDKRSNDIATTCAKRGLKPGKFLLFLSRLAPAKGVDDLITAYRHSDAYGRMPLAICGNGPAEQELRRLAAENPNIDFFTDVSDADKGLLMHACAGYCLPSKPRKEFIETFGIAVAEKLLAGGLGPVITTTTGGLPEATGDHCLYHEAGDVRSLRDAIDLAIAMKPEERATLNAEGRHYAMQFDRHAVLSKLIARQTASAAALAV
jgi:glycosyltransferase involved in cell wall biosynthesis